MPPPSSSSCSSCVSLSSKLSSLTRLNSSLQQELLRAASQSRDNYRVKKIHYLEGQLKASQQYAGALGELLISHGLADSSQLAALLRRAEQEEIVNSVAIQVENDKLKKELAKARVKKPDSEGVDDLVELSPGVSDLAERCRDLEAQLESQRVQLACDRLELSECQRLREELKAARLQDGAIQSELSGVRDRIAKLAEANEALRSALDQERRAAEFQRRSLLKEIALLQSGPPVLSEAEADEGRRVEYIRVVQRLKREMAQQTEQFARALGEARSIAQHHSANADNERVENELLLEEHEHTILRQFEAREMRAKMIETLKDKIKSMKQQMKSMKLKEKEREEKESKQNANVNQ